MFFSSFNELYEKIIFEAEYDTDKWQRFDTYKDIEIYYNIDHIKQRLANRYPLYRLGNIRQFVITFLKTLIKIIGLKILIKLKNLLHVIALDQMFGFQED